MIDINRKYIINFSPADHHISEIKKWLIDEERKTRKGFYCNWEIIKSSYVKGQLITISHRNRTIGFATFYSNTEKTIKIEIAEIKPSYRKKGAGKKLTAELLKHFKDKGVVVAYLQCAPETSEPIWKKLGFIEYPDPPENYNFNASGNKQLFQILTPHINPNNLGESNERIELWNDEPYRTGDTEPTYVWHLEFIPNTRKLKTPIIHPAHYEWRIRWTSNGKVIKDNKIKYFGKEIDYETFIVIDELP